MADTFRIRATRPLHAGARACKPGEVVALPAIEAAQAIGAGRAALCDAGDEADMRAAIDAEAVRTMRALGQAGHGKAPGYWQPLPLR
jgi:hypothetical protein